MRNNRSLYHSYLMHHGVKGMKWGVRRYQNADGTLTSLGKKREEYREIKKQGKTGYAERIGDGPTYAIWENKKQFNKNVNEQKKAELSKATSFEQKHQIRNKYKNHKRRVAWDNLERRASYREAAKLVKDSMKAEIKDVPVEQITKGRHKTELILSRTAATGVVIGSIAAYIFIEDKLG